MAKGPVSAQSRAPWNLLLSSRYLSLSLSRKCSFPIYIASGDETCNGSDVYGAEEYELYAFFIIFIKSFALSRIPDAFLFVPLPYVLLLLGIVVVQIMSMSIIPRGSGLVPPPSLSDFFPWFDLLFVPVFSYLFYTVTTHGATAAAFPARVGALDNLSC
jgi:hypothetical protein